MPSTLVDLLRAGMEDCDAAVRFLGSDDLVVETTWGEIWRNALARAAALQDLGVRPGARVALLGFTSQPLIETIVGTVCAGATVTMLPLPMRLASVDAFVESTRGRLTASGAALLVVDSFFAENYEAGAADPPTVHIDDLVRPTPLPQPVPTEAEDLCVLQFTSGSTSDPRAVRLHNGALAANLHAMTKGIGLGEDDVFVSWLPLYHDMGLIGGVFAPAARSVSATYAAPQVFLGRPAMWMEAVSRYRATVIVAPNFAYGLAARALRRAENIDLSCVRAALCGAEPIDAANMANFYDEAARFGLRPGTALAVYGLAECTLAVTFPELGAGLGVDRVNRVVLEREKRAVPGGGEACKQVVCLGRPLAGIAIRVVNEDGDDCAEREVGEVLVAGQSVMQGYDRHPRATASVLRDGWLHTGDLGYLACGELYLCGRAKDVIIVGGRNIFPEDVENAAQAVDGVRAGNAIAFSVDGARGKEALVLVAETRLDANAAGQIAHTIVEAVRSQVGLPPRHVVLLPPGELPKTSSGKLQRSLCRSRYLKGELAPVASIGRT